MGPPFGDVLVIGCYPMWLNFFLLSMGKIKITCWGNRRFTMEWKNPLQEWNITLIVGWKIIGTNMALNTPGNFLQVFSNSMELLSPPPHTHKKEKKKKEKKKKEKKRKTLVEKKSNWRKKERNKEKNLTRVIQKKI